MAARVLFVVLAVAATAASAAPPLAVPLALEERAGVARRAWPASASVPLPRGRVRSPEGLWIATPDGGAAPAQLRTLERWPDGTVRWLLIDFLADVPSGAQATYTLRDGKAPASPSGARVRAQPGADGGRVLDTGALHVAVPGRGDALLADLAAGSVRLGGPIAVPAISLDGGRDSASEQTQLTVETEGPIRTEVLVRGRYAAGIAWETRIAAFAGRSFLRLRHTITNMADPSYLPLRSLALAVPGRFASATLGIDGGTRDLPSLDGAHELRHLDATPALLDGDEVGKHADGWVGARGGGAAVTVFARDLWREYPKTITVAPTRIAVDLFAGGDKPLRFGTGAAKTHEVWIALEPEAHATPPADLAAAFYNPLVAIVPARWIVASRALPQALDPDAPGARAFLGNLANAFARYREKLRTERWDDGLPVPCSERTEEHPRVGLYGVFNWGDWQFPGYRDHVRGCDGWGNLEYDLSQVLALGWTSTGEREFYEGLGAAARHYRDVDIIHHAPGHPQWVGMNHPHKALHFAVESRETVDLGHTWTEGLVSYWRLTGDQRALDAARGIADVLARAVSKAQNPRQFGWPMLALVAVWDATGERRYLDAARAYADAGTGVFRPTPASGNWMMGILADGVAAVHEATGDQRLRRWLVAYADALVAEPGRWPDPRFALPLGYLAKVTGDERYEQTALTTASTMKIPDWGKPLAAIGRTGFRLLAPLAERTGLRPSPPAPTPPIRKPGLTPGRDAPRRRSPRARQPPSPSPAGPDRPLAD